MIWSKPTFVELRFGFEVTMYIWNRWDAAARMPRAWWPAQISF